MNATDKRVNDRANIDQANIDRANIDRANIDQANIDQANMNQANIDQATPPRVDLAHLANVELDDHLQQILDRASENCGGSPIWKARKRAEARELTALVQIAPRLELLDLDLREALRAAIVMRTPVACLPNPDGPLVVEPQALLGLSYREEAIKQSLPGYAFVQILAPRPCWNANIAFDPAQVLCLGASLPAGVRVMNLLLMTYGALTMQTVQIDLLDPAGVMNANAAVWWQLNTDRVPLSREPFLAGPPVSRMDEPKTDQSAPDQPQEQP